MAAGKEDENDLARDSVAIDEIGGILHAGYDPGGYGAHADPESTLHVMHSVSKMIYCLSPEQTTQAKMGSALVKCLPDQMAKLAVTYPYPAVVARHICAPAELAPLSSSIARAETLEKLLSLTQFLETYLMPFTATIEDKAQIYKQEV